MPPEYIVKWLAVAADAAKILAVLAAGIWSVFLFSALRQWSRGRIELQNLIVGREKTEREIRKIDAELKKLEFESFRQAVLHLSMKISQVPVPGDGGRYVLGAVEIENKGNRNTRVSWERQEPLAVRRVTITDSGETVYGPPMPYKVSAGREQLSMGGWIVRVGAREQVPFCIRLDNPGLYQIVFRGNLSVEEKEVSSQLGVQTDDWWIMTYTVVE